MKRIATQHPFRLGTTSYIIPDDILPNVRHLAGQVDDVELVIFELEDGRGNLPAPQVLRELSALAARHDLSYTIHLPLDLRLGANGEEQHASLVKAQRVIEGTRQLEPWAYVLHLDGREVRDGASAEQMATWRSQARRALTIAAGWTGGGQRLAVENLEGYPPDLNLPVLDGLDAGLCVDVGHLWRDGHDAMAFLERTLARARVIHLHGVAERDHQSLACTPPDQVLAVLRLLMRYPYRGVVTLEVFNQEDLSTSLEALEWAIQRALE